MFHIILVFVVASCVGGGRGLTTAVGGTTASRGRSILDASPSSPRPQSEATPLGARVKPGNCSDACYQRATCNEEVGGRCDCPKHLAGLDCVRKAAASDMAPYTQSEWGERRAPLPCLNNCTGRGHCVFGSCVCSRGQFGSDCSMSLDASGRPVLLAGTGYTPRERRPRIYVYNVQKADRPLAWVFWERLLGSGALVADGEDADWFWIPVKLRSTSDGYRLMESIEYVREKWPWYDRHQGHRHFVIHGGDTGRGEVTGKVRAATNNLTWLHHWGLTVDIKNSRWKAAHRPGKDIVVPIHFTPRQGHSCVPFSGLHPRAPRLNRTHTLLFAGRICGDHSEPDISKPWPHCATNTNMGYSQGVRQRVHFHHHSREGYKIVTKNPLYGLDMLNYKWCLAPSGGGHGHRQTLAALVGCLPLVISNNVLQPFEPEMDWAAFSLRVEEADIPRLHEHLEAAEARKGWMDARRDALYCAAQHLAFSGSAGAFMQEDGRWDAFEMILEILRMRQEHPGVEPARYASVDERFRSFLHCGEPDMAAYGRKRRAQALERYPELPGLAPDGRAVTWQDLYSAAPPANTTKPVGPDRNFKPLLDSYKKPRPGERPEPPLPLCSLSAWDVRHLRCDSHGFLSRARHGFAPGGAACNEHDGDLARCPRVWG
ncbi:hypothetical protein GPECTOR_2g1382 [Gonium pectorale]|uniref:EGF-like domain-containing protein n=1 Tax=Gonium pectorale TaxID=33097 RepID=A0A150H163_GONPE|nr:hypothetical protein GPECTOR_2g1382 [Gonium pectorale]|eukprot:KXZ55831.1 hypothetical protein GPECTOR_2g1382 [Gonium pectorale]